MNFLRSTIVAALFAGLVLSGAVLAGESEPIFTRVLYLQGMEVREAVTLLRSQVHVRQMATIQGRNLVIIAETLDKIEQSETVLRQKDAVSRVAEPHPPLELRKLGKAPAATRTFHVGAGVAASTVTILRSIYQMRELTEEAESNSVSARAAPAVLDAGEALLQELGLLVEP